MLQTGLVASLLSKEGELNFQQGFTATAVAAAAADIMHNITATLTGKSVEELERQQQINIQLPKIKPQGATVNVVLDADHFKDISLGGMCHLVVFQLVTLTCRSTCSCK